MRGLLTVTKRRMIAISNHAAFDLISVSFLRYCLDRRLHLPGRPLALGEEHCPEYGQLSQAERPPVAIKRPMRRAMIAMAAAMVSATIAFHTHVIQTPAAARPDK